MNRELLIFLFLYFAGVAISPAFCHDSEKIFQTASEDGIGDVQDVEPLFSEIPGLDYDHGNLYFFSGDQYSSPLSSWSEKGSLILQDDRIFQRPLFLLFHSFIFYDLVC